MTPRGGGDSEAARRTWLEIDRGGAPLLVSFPHTGTDIPADIEPRLASGWLARKDTDWWVHRLYGMTRDLDATTVRTTMSRTMIDVNRDPSGASLYPGRATTELCPLATFDGEPLYVAGSEPDAAEIAVRRTQYFEPYHIALAAEIERLRAEHRLVVLYDAHSIRSRIPRLFEGTLHHFNLGTHDGRSCDLALTRIVEQACEHPGFTRVTDGRFKGGWTVRHHGRPGAGVHAVQMELACRAYLEEPSETVSEENWPGEFDSARAALAQAVLARVLEACVRFARTQRGRPK
ncbi:MAG TPA: N-formylglutamate deformylase [Steroidobacteraceae bacterium]|jgi:formiminoglutamase